MRLYYLLKYYWKRILLYGITIFIAAYPLPYYIDAPGGLININNRMQVDSEYNDNTEGTFNLTYVAQYRANIPLFLIALINPNWKIHTKNEVTYNKETYESSVARDKIYLQLAYSNATMVAYNQANKLVKVIGTDIYVDSCTDYSDTDLKVGDRIVQINNNDISNIDDIHRIVNNSQVGDKLTIYVENEGQKRIRHATVTTYKNKHVIGVSMLLVPKLETDPKVKFNYADRESGPSGGLMMTLSIYNSLVEEDLTKGLTVVGTGTIDNKGLVGEIAGIEFKLKGAVKKHADIFFVPNGKNYEDAMNLKKQNKYDIEIVGVASFKDALKYLESIK